MVAKAEGRDTGAVDLLVTGCEVSLWVGEQFAADMHNAFPTLRIVTISANKVRAMITRHLHPLFLLIVTFSAVLSAGSCSGG